MHIQEEPSQRIQGKHTKSHAVNCPIEKGSTKVATSPQKENELRSSCVDRSFGGNIATVHSAIIPCVK